MELPAGQLLLNVMRLQAQQVHIEPEVVMAALSVMGKLLRATMVVMTSVSSAVAWQSFRFVNK